MKSPVLWRKTISLWLFCCFRIPLIFWLKPRIVEVSDRRGVVQMKFRRRTRNHVNSMYFGALCVGAELSAGIVVMHLFAKRKEKYTFLFKDFTADFLKRCESDVYFVFEEGHLVEEIIASAHQNQQRQNVLLNIKGIVNDEVIANFTMTLSVKERNGSSS